jgi:hypothetical protein
MKAVWMLAAAGACAALAAHADTITIACGDAGARVVIDTRGFVREPGSSGEGATLQARVTDHEIDYVADRQPYTKTTHRIDRRTGIDSITLYSYRDNAETHSTRTCQKVATDSANAF